MLKINFQRVGLNLPLIRYLVIARVGTLSFLEKLKFTLLDIFLQIIIKSIMVINFMYWLP